MTRRHIIDRQTPDEFPRRPLEFRSDNLFSRGRGMISPLEMLSLPGLYW